MCCIEIVDKGIDVLIRLTSSLHTRMNSEVTIRCGILDCYVNNRLLPFLLGINP